MAYSVLRKHPLDKTISTAHIIEFLADEEADKTEIEKENCAPGSTIEVLSATPATTKKTYIKTPSGDWKEYIAAPSA